MLNVLVQMGDNSATSPRRRAYKLPILELLSLIAAICAATVFVPATMQHKFARLHAR